MEKSKIIGICMITIMILFSGCQNNEQTLNDSEESKNEKQAVVDDSNGLLEDEQQENEYGTTEEKNIEENEKADEHQTSRNDKENDTEEFVIQKYELKDFGRVPKQPKRQIFTIDKSIDKSAIKDIVIKKNAWINWNHSSSVSSFQLLIDNHQALFSFGNAYNGKDEVRQTIVIPHNDILEAGYLEMKDSIVLLTRPKDYTGEISFEYYNYVGDLLDKYSFDGYDGATDFHMYSSDIESFYLLYKKEGIYYVDTYSYSNDSLSIEKREKFLDSVKNIYVVRNAIMIEMEEGLKRFLYRCNKAFAVMNIIEMDEDINLFYVENGPDGVNLYADIDGKIYEKYIKMGNDYKHLSKYTVLENQSTIYNTKHEYHYYAEGRWDIYENGVLIEAENLDTNSGRANYFKYNNRIFKTNSEYDVCYLLEECGEEINKFIKIKDFYIGVNPEYDICYIDPAYKDRWINKAFLGERIASGITYYDEASNGITYINDNEKCIYRIDKEGKKELSISIPEEIWEVFTNGEEKMIPGEICLLASDSYGIGIGMYGRSGKSFCHYSIENKSWREISVDQYIRYIPGKGYFYEKDDVTYKMNERDYSFEPYILNEREVCQTIILDDILYINGFYDYETNYVESEDYQMMDSEFITLKSNNHVMKIIDYMKNSTYEVVKEYMTKNIWLGKDNEYIQIINEPVRLFSLSNEGLLYSGYEDKAYAYYYDFKTGSVRTIYEEECISDLHIKENMAYLLIDSKIIQVNIENQEQKVIQLDQCQGVFEAGKDYIAVGTKDYRTIYIISMDTLEIDKIGGSSGFRWVENILYYDSFGYLTKYDLVSGKMILLNLTVYPYVIAIHKGQVYYGMYYDGPPGFGSVSENVVYDLIKDEAAKDYYILNNQDHYRASLMLYDANNQQLKFLAENENVEYQVDGNVIRYRDWRYLYKEVDGEWKKEKLISEWKEEVLKEGATIGKDGFLIS